MKLPFQRALLGMALTFSLAAALPALASGPSVSSVTFPSTVNANASALLSATVSSNVTVTACNLYVDSADAGVMTVANNFASVPYTFPRGGVFTLFVFCRDSSGGFASGADTSIFVQGEIQQQPTFNGGDGGSVQPPVQIETPVITHPIIVASTSTVPMDAKTAPGNLIKLACTAQSDVSDPCRAVYYVGKDGKRHAFPNGKVFGSWYANFDSVVTVTGAELSALPLGKNLNYRPGVIMVKFTTDPKVYAVGKMGLLRWIKTEAAATALYGVNWNTKIDDIPDTFYTNYSFGADIASSNDYSASVEMINVGSVDQNL